MKTNKAGVMTTINVEGKTMWASASLVLKVQNFIEAGKRVGEISDIIKRPRPYTQALVNSIKEHAQMGRVA